MAERIIKMGNGQSQDTVAQARMERLAGHQVAASQALTLTGKSANSFLKPGSNVESGAGTSSNVDARLDRRQPKSKETSKMIKSVASQAGSVSGIKSKKALKPAVAMTSKAPKKLSDTNRKSTTYIVRSGDTLWAIAKKFNVSLPRLCRANAIQKDCSLIGLKRRTSPLVRGRVLVIQRRG